MAEAKRLSLSGLDLTKLNFCNADLRNTDLRNTDLRNADLRNADLKDADFSNAELSGADLSCANLTNTRFHDARLRYARLINAKIEHTSFCGADLTRASCMNIDLRTADIRHAVFYGVRMQGALVGDIPISAGLSGLQPVFPTHGAFTIFKKLAEDKIAMLEVPAYAKRSSATTRKGRVSEAYVVAIWDERGKPCSRGVSLRDPDFAYVVGTTVVSDAFDPDRWNECSSGIHCFLTREEAERW